MSGPTFELKEHRIPLERSHVRGWGKVSIPADANPADNDDWFVFDDPAPRRAIVVAEDTLAARPLQPAASIAPEPQVKCSAEVVTIESLGTVEWEKVALLLWQAPLPAADLAKRITAFVDRGGQVLFFPPRNPGPAEFQGTSGRPGPTARRTFRSKTGGATRICSLRPRAVGHCRWVSFR